jgi:hypothetical protein
MTPGKAKKLNPARRLREIVEAVDQIDCDAPDAVDHLRRLKILARLTLDEVTLGRGHNYVLPEARLRASEVRRERYYDLCRVVKPMIARFRKEGRNSYSAIAEALDASGVRPPKAERWALSTIRKIEMETLPEDK